jgi:hypothetical protein
MINLDNPEDRHRIGQARLLRRQGKTYDEIRARLGPLSNDTLREWLRGIPRPANTRRSHPHTELAKTCRRLRAQGLTFGEIIDVSGASAGSVSLWLRGVKVPMRVEERRREHLRQLRGLGGRVVHQAAVRRQEVRVGCAAGSLGHVTNRELFIAGVVLYWAEGTKGKPWRRGGRVTVINGDPTILRLFLSWLDLLGVPEQARRYRLSIHVNADVDRHQRWWADQLGLSTATFYRATLKRHNPTPSRYNREETYHGCLVVSVAKSTALYDAIEGWWQALSSASPAGIAGTANPPRSRRLQANPVPGGVPASTADFDSVRGGSTPPPGARPLDPWLPIGWWDRVAEPGSVGSAADFLAALQSRSLGD